MAANETETTLVALATEVTTAEKLVRELSSPTDGPGLVYEKVDSPLGTTFIPHVPLEFIYAEPPVMPESEIPREVIEQIIGANPNPYTPGSLAGTFMGALPKISPGYESRILSPNPRPMLPIIESFESPTQYEEIGNLAGAYQDDDPILAIKPTIGLPMNSAQIARAIESTEDLFPLIEAQVEPTETIQYGRVKIGRAIPIKENLDPLVVKTPDKILNQILAIGTKEAFVALFALMHNFKNGLAVARTTGSNREREQRFLEWLESCNETYGELISCARIAVQTAADYAVRISATTFNLTPIEVWAVIAACDNFFSAPPKIITAETITRAEARRRSGRIGVASLRSIA